MRLVERVDGISIDDGDGSEPLQPSLPDDAPETPRNAEHWDGKSDNSGANTSQSPNSSEIRYDSVDPTTLSEYQRLQYDRRTMPVAPSNVDTQSFPDVFLECGCGDCHETVDPLYGGFDGAFESSIDAPTTCPEPTPVEWWKAARVYLRIQVPVHRRDNHYSKAQKQDRDYRRICETDRRLRQEEYNDLTTVLISLRVSPREEGEWVNPYRLDTALHEPWDDLYARLRYQLRDYEWEYCAVTEGTEWFATPHLHIHLWIDDPDDEIGVDHFTPVVETFVEECRYATWSGHPVSDEKTVHIEYEPPIAEESGYRFNRPTAGALYTATSLAHLPLDNRVRDDRTCRMTDIEAAVLSWISPYDWLRTSRGVRHE